MIDFFKSSLFLLLLTFLLINGCSKEEEETISEQTKQDHVWKSQVQALEKAKDVEQVLINAEKNRRQTVDE